RVPGSGTASNVKRVTSPSPSAKSAVGELTLPLVKVPPHAVPPVRMVYRTYFGKAEPSLPKQAHRNDEHTSRASQLQQKSARYVPSSHAPSRLPRTIVRRSELEPGGDGCQPAKTLELFAPFVVSLTDPRVNRRKRHQLLDIVILGVT